MGLNTKHEQVGGSADASKTQKHRQVGGSRAIFPTEQHAGLWQCAIPNVGWNVIRRSDGHTETWISSSTHRAISVIFPCQLQASTHSCSKRLRITMLQADDSSYNSNSVITQSGRDMGSRVSLSIIPRERCLHNETIWSPTASYFVSRRYYP
jgi:hypothetical protein